MRSSFGSGPNKSIIRRRQVLSSINNWWWGGGSGGGTPLQPEATAFFDRMVVLGDPVPDAYKTLYNDVIYWLKNTNGYDGVTPLWDGFDLFRFEATYSKTASLQNAIGDIHNGTIVNDHGSSFVADQGLNGNGTNFRVDCNYNPFDGGVYKFTSNSQSYGVITLENLAAGNQELGCATTLSGGHFLQPRITTGAYIDDFIGSAGITTTTASGAMSTILTIGLFSVRKTASLTNRQNSNGYNSPVDFVGSTDYDVNLDMTEFCRNVNSVYNNFSSNTHALLYAGNKNIDANKVLGIFYKYWLKPLNNSVSKIGNRVCFLGDSMTGPSAALSVNSAYSRQVMTVLGAGWISANMGIANRGWGDTALVPIGITDGIPTDQVPYRNTYLDKDIVVIWAGTNDLAKNVSANDLHTLIQTGAQLLKDAGFTVILVGIADRDASFSGGQTAGGFATANAALRTTMLTEFNVATSVTNVFAKATGITYADYYCDIFSDASFTNASDLTYFQADQIHINGTAAALLANNFVAPTIQLI